MNKTTSSASCQCSAAPKLIFACSGASDVGEIADLTARRLTKKGAGKMYCLAGLGGRLPGFIKTTSAAGKILAIDGCSHDCAKHTLLAAGITNFEHLQLKSLGLEKGSSLPTEENIQTVVNKGQEMLMR
jgi:uncharacterized metal-binding protein